MNGKLITGGVIKQVKHNAKLDVSFIDRSLGRTFQERAGEMDETNSAKMMGVQMLELEPGSFGDFEFGYDQSVETARTACS